MLLVWISRSAIPACLSASRTLAIRVAACWIAPLAVAERVTTPAEMIARSGTRLTSPVALMSRRVPAIVWVVDGAGRPPAPAGRPAAPIASPARIAYFIFGFPWQSFHDGNG